MAAFDRELIPTPIERMEREYPEWALSTSRLKTKARRAVLQLEGSDSFTPTELQHLRAVLMRLRAEGPNPVFYQLVAHHGFEPGA